MSGTVNLRCSLCCSSGDEVMPFVAPHNTPDVHQLPPFVRRTIAVSNTLLDTPEPRTGSSFHIIPKIPGSTPTPPEIISPTDQLIRDLLSHPLRLAPTPDEIIFRMKNTTSAKENNVIIYYDDFDDENLEYNCLSMYYPCQIKFRMDGIDYIFPCAEAAFIAHMFYTDAKNIPQNIKEKIKDLLQKCAECKSPKDLMEIAKENIAYIRHDWEEVSKSLLKTILVQKFLQNPGLLSILMRTHGFPLVRNSTHNEDGRYQIPLMLNEIRKRYVPVISGNVE